MPSLADLTCSLDPIRVGQRCNPKNAEECTRALLCGGRTLMLISMAAQYALSGLLRVWDALPALVLAARCSAKYHATSARTLLASLRIK